MTAPSNAGGYQLTTPMSAAIKAIGTPGAGELLQAVEESGGKETSAVSGEYLILGDQALGYAGFTGTFNPQDVQAAFAKMAASGGTTSLPAGPHGGQLACELVAAPPGSTSGAASAGTACVWATTSTVGMVEFFGGQHLESVVPSKAGQDTVKFRDGVEAASS